MHIASFLANPVGVTNRTYVIEASRDDEADVWISASDIPGLVIEAASEDEFRELAATLGPELLADHGLDASSRIELRFPGRPSELIAG